MNKWLKIAHNIVSRCLKLPCLCILCFQGVKRDFALCHDCEALLPWLGFSCCFCAAPLAESRLLCHACLQCRPTYDRLQALFYYKKPVSLFVRKLKFSGQLHFAKMLGSLMAENLKPSIPVDCILPVPLHPLRQRERGFNQALELAKIIAKKQQMNLDRWSCTRRINTRSQATLTAQKRAVNITPKAFAISPNFKAKHVLVIDDVVTTGATVEALTVALKGAGCIQVEVWSCCRTL